MSPLLSASSAWKLVGSSRRPLPPATRPRRYSARTRAALGNRSTGAGRAALIRCLGAAHRSSRNDRAAMEGALELWVAAGGASTPFTEHGAAHALATRATRLTRACLSYAGDGDDSSRRTESGMARSLGLTSIARHGFYGSFVAAAVKNEVAHAAPSGGAEQRLSSLAEERTPSSISSGAATNFIFGVDDAAILRELLGVLHFRRRLRLGRVPKRGLLGCTSGGRRP